jgi:hypothetical protein
VTKKLSVSLCVFRAPLAGALGLLRLGQVVGSRSTYVRVGGIHKEDGLVQTPSAGERWFTHATPTLFNAGAAANVELLPAHDEGQLD